MTTQFQKQVKQILEQSSNVFPSKILCKKDGSVEVKKSYFYRHGYSAEKWSEKVNNVLQEAGLNCQSTSYDDWNAWPKDSYFVAIVKES